MFVSLVFATVEHAHIAATGLPVQFSILGALLALLGITLAFALVRCRHFGDEGTK
jgi:hypothetical protein